MARYKEEYLDTDKLYKLVGRNIQRLRQQAGMTQEDLDKLNRDVDAGKTDENVAGSHNGVALQNIKRRLKLYWGKEAYMIATSTLNYGTEMHLMLPLLFTKEDYMKS